MKPTMKRERVEHLLLPDDHRLKPRQIAWLNIYLADPKFNAKKAVLEAGYSPKGARTQASILLNHPILRKIIDERLAIRGCNRDRILALLASLSFDADMADFEPWIEGEMTLAELRQRGIRTKLLKHCKRRIVTYNRTHKDGSTSEIRHVITDITMREIQWPLGQLMRLQGMNAHRNLEESADEEKRRKEQDERSGHHGRRMGELDDTIAAAKLASEKDRQSDEEAAA